MEKRTDVQKGREKASLKKRRNIGRQK